MKSHLFKNALLPSILLMACSLSAQQFSLFAPGNGDPAVLKYFDGEKMQQVSIPDINENPVVKFQGPDGIFMIDLGESYHYQENRPDNDRSDVLSLIDAGVPLEGDLPAAIQFAKDGTFYAIAYQQSDNVIFYDASTNALLASVPVGRQPLDIKMSNDFAYVCCHLGQALYIISLDDFSLSGYVPLDGLPCQVELTNEEDTAYVACATFTQGQFAKVDLDKRQQVSFRGPYFHHYGWMSSYGRTFYKFTRFSLSPDGNQMITVRQGSPTVFNPHTSAIIKTLDIGGWCGAAYSKGGDSLYVYSHQADTVKMYLYNSADLTVMDSICPTAACWLGLADYSGLVFNGDNTKVLTADFVNGRYCLFDFNTHSCQLIPALDIVMDDPLYTSADGEYAVSAAGMHVNIINFESGTVTNSYDTYPDLEPQLPVAVSPVENRLLVGNLNYYQGDINYNESIYSFNFSDPDNLIFDTAMICGQLPEADVPQEVCFSGDGKNLLVANLLTHNLSIISRTNDLTDTIVPYNLMSGIKAVPGTNQAVVYGKSTGFFRIISLDTYEVLANLPIPHVRDVYFTSDGQFCYTVEYITGGQYAHINKIVMDGASSYVQHFTSISGRTCGLIYTVSEVQLQTSSAFSPDEKLLLVGAMDPDFGMVVNIVDAENLDLLASVPAPSECILDFAFTDDSQRVLAVGTDNIRVSIIYLDREASFLEHVVNIHQESYSADYNSIDGYFYVLGDEDNIYMINPSTGEIENEQVINYDMNLRIRFDNRGIPMVLTANSLIYDRETYPLPGVSAILTYDEDQDLFLVPLPGPDMVCVFDPKVVGIQLIKPHQQRRINIFPNPATNTIVINSADEINRVTICNIGGSKVYSGEFMARHVQISALNMAPGIYIADVETVSGKFAGKVVVK